MVVDDNTAVGVYALKNQTNSSKNTAVGNGAGWEITTGSENTLIGESYRCQYSQC